MERRLSTGGKPPVKIEERYIIEEAPSRGGLPCATAWFRHEIVEFGSKIHEGWSLSDYDYDRGSPPWSIQVYDTSEDAGHVEHLILVAETLHKQTRDDRENHEAQVRVDRDRIDVWGMPLPFETSESERIARCKMHFEGFVQSEFMRLPSFHWRWRKGILIIDRPPHRWGDDEEAFMTVFWDASPESLEHFSDDQREDLQRGEVARYSFSGVRQKLGGLTLKET